MIIKTRTAIIIGAGPAGLTLAYELLLRTNIKPIILEATCDIGGISKTICYKGNRIDIGGHRFFSKSDRVMKWWQSILPIQDAISPHPNVIDPDKVLLVRKRLSRILFLRKFFDYPISLSIKTAQNLGFLRLLKIALSYLKICIFPQKREKSLEDFFINRFGKELYSTFFKDYTQKVWGVPCNQIKPEWGTQRIKGLSISKAILHAIKRGLLHDPSYSQKTTETTLIERFLYPKFGPGQMWETVAQKVQDLGGEICLSHKVCGLLMDNRKIVEVEFTAPEHLRPRARSADYYFSTMPVKDLIESLKGPVPHDVREVADGLIYRDFITVGLLLSSMIVDQQNKSNILPDNWIYIQEPDVKVGRLQIFNNWSPYMVQNSQNIWVGLEYFCNEGDALWEMNDMNLASFAVGELVKIGIIDRHAVLDSTVIRVPKTYPAYFGTYDRFSIIRDFTDKIENLYLLGRNGMHKYNNQDHSMLTAMTAVDNILSGIQSKNSIWAVNTEQDYHESK